MLRTNILRFYYIPWSVFNNFSQRNAWKPKKYSNNCKARFMNMRVGLLQTYFWNSGAAHNQRCCCQSAYLFLSRILFGIFLKHKLTMTTFFCQRPGSSALNLLRSSTDLLKVRITRNPSYVKEVHSPAQDCPVTKIIRW